MLSADEWRHYAIEIYNDGTPSQVGPSSEECREVAALIEAAQKVLDGLNRRIQEAPADAAPVFEGIAALSDALLPQTGEAEPEKSPPASVSEGERGTLSDLEICNLALSRIAAEPISSLDENSPAARHCAELYAPTLDNLLRCGTWPYRPLLANALSWRLAADLALAVRSDVTRHHEAMGEFSRALLANKEAGIAETAIGQALSKRECEALGIPNPDSEIERVNLAAIEKLRGQAEAMSAGEQGNAWTRGAATALHALIVGFRELDLAQHVAREIHLSTDDIGSCGLEPGTAARVIEGLSNRENGA